MSTGREGDDLLMMMMVVLIAPSSALRYRSVVDTGLSSVCRGQRRKDGDKYVVCFSTTGPLRK